MLIAPEEIFPWDKVDAAKRYLSAVKPWWSRFLDHFVIVPVEVMPDTEGVLPYGSTTATDRDLRIYVDRLFALSVPVHYLAGAIEHELQRHTRDSWQRFKFLKGEEWREEAVPALDLEINSTLDREQLAYDMDMVEDICADSAMFTQSELKYWNITAPPGLDDEGWVPRVLGLDDALSAEQYHQIIKKLMETPPPQEEDKDDDGDTSDDGEDDEPEQDESDNQDSPSESGKNGESSEDDDEDAEQEDDEENADSVQEDGEEDDSEDEESGSDDNTEDENGSEEENGNDDGDSSDSENGDSEDEEAEEEESGNDGNQGEDGGLDNDGGSESDESDSDNNEDDANGNKSQSEGSESDSGNGSSTETGGTSGGSGGELSDWDKSQLIKELKNSEIGQMWKNSIENPTDPFDHPAWKPDQDTPEYDLPDRPSDTEISEAFAQLQEDIGENEDMLSALASTFGSDGGNRLLQWRDEYRRSRGMNWTQRFMRLANALLTSVQIKGQSDLSYSVRNPNQQQVGPILQGLLAYSPTIYVLQDVSGSMSGNMGKSMSIFTDICKAMLNSFGDKVVWFSADMTIRDVGKTSRWDENVNRAFHYGFGGTESFGGIIEQLMTGKLVYKGKRYKKPDLVIVCTDCIFPWSETRPRNSSKILTVNVGDLAHAENYLPDWIDRRREFVQVD